MLHVGRSRRRARPARVSWQSCTGVGVLAWSAALGARSPVQGPTMRTPPLGYGIGLRTETETVWAQLHYWKKSRKRDMIVKNCRLDRRPAPPWRILPVHASCGFSEGFRAPHPTGSEHGVGHRARAAPSCTVATGCGASLSFAQARGRACPPRVRACLLQASLQHDAARHYSGHNSRHGGDVHRRSRRSRPASLRAPPESGFC